MIDPSRQYDIQALEHAIALAEAALSQCDEHGFVYAAIDISAAVDKLKALRAAIDRNR
jgi:hypothetical protein